MNEFDDEFPELAGIAHDLALWYERVASSLACPCCETYREPHGAACPIGRAIEYRKRIVSTV